MFEFIKIKKAAKEFQSKYNLTDDEMSDICFMKIGERYIGGIKPNVVNLPLYRKITKLDFDLKTKLDQAKGRFEELTRKFSKEEIFNVYRDDCNEDLEGFAYLFQYNSSFVRISFSPGTTNVNEGKWNKVYSYFDAICLYYLLSYYESVVYKKYAILSALQFIAKKGELDFDSSYDELREFVDLRVNRLLSPTGNNQGMEQDWLKASILSI